MSDGGRLTIETDVIVDDNYADFQGEVGAYVRVRVSDSGSGMSPEALKRAMDPFFTTKPEGMGTGLGLATVYFNVTQMRGRFELHSEEGHGTTASILLPVTDATPENVVRTAPERTGGGGETVLVVEDEAAMREVTRRMLALQGYDVITAANGLEALAIAREHEGEIHLLLTDVVMPHMLGSEVARRLCARRPTLRVLFMSGYAHTGRGPDEPLEAGSVLLEKPFSERTLLAKVHQLLGSGGSPSTNEVIVQDTTAAQLPGGGAIDTAAIRVLLVDDHLMFVESVQRVLGADASFNVVGVAETCARATELAAALQPDVAMVDYRLPDGDGGSLTTKIRSLSPSTQVLILTGLRDDRSFSAAMAAGCAGFLTKNRAFDDLVDAVRRVHAGDSFLPTELLSNLLPQLRVGYRPVGHDLTERELEILGYLAQGMSTETMAKRLMLSIHTVRNHVQRILTKLEAHSKLEAVAVAARSGILDEIG
jgi:DNA-binding NarL/FixJ family response regulator